jgi:hypothetical protein
MNTRLTASPPELRKWCMYAVILLLPGSFVVLPALWLVKFIGARSTGDEPGATALRALRLKESAGGFARLRQFDDFGFQNIQRRRQS